MLNPEKFADWRLIREGLKQPYLVIENALIPEVAEQLYSDLLNYQQWHQQDHRNDLSPEEQLHQDRYNPEYTFSRDKITLGEDTAPASVTNLFERLRSPEILSYFSNASGRPCDDFQLSATKFRQGNHIAEHNDYYVKKRQDGSTVARTLTFNYYLTKNWRPEWGGRFIWKKPYAEIIPTFNTLVLFRVGQTSYHVVEDVTKQALEPRIALTGWYFSVRKPGNTIKTLFQ